MMVPAGAAGAFGRRPERVIALRYGHRVSVDVDYLTAQPLDAGAA
jgi:hypothetical protein